MVCASLCHSIWIERISQIERIACALSAEGQLFILDFGTKQVILNPGGHQLFLAKVERDDQILFGKNAAILLLSKFLFSVIAQTVELASSVEAGFCVNYFSFSCLEKTKFASLSSATTWFGVHTHANVWSHLSFTLMFIVLSYGSERLMLA